MTSPAILGALVGGVLSVLLYSWYRSKHSVPLPPGPKGHFILGNALEVRNASAFWLKFAEYADQYGPIISVRMVHQYSIIVSDPRIISELFEKRAANYSDRGFNQMVKLIGWDKIIVFLHYGPMFKLYRTMLQRALNNRAALDYVPLQQLEVRKFMQRLVEQPSDFMENVHLMSAGITIRMAYGYEVLSSHDPFVQTAEKLMAGFSDAMTPAKWAVDIFPFLQHLPVWFPLATFQRRAQSLRHLDCTHSEEPFKYVEKSMAEGTAEESFTSKLLISEDGEPVDKQTKEHIKSIAATLYAAGADTIVSIVRSFFLAMTLYPDVQSKSQAEITAYLKQRSIYDESSRMISPSDRPHLPYTSALVRELLRWHPAVNMVAHRSSNEDDNNVVWEGNTYRIPAQTLVVANIWKIMHDPDVYEQPERFMPERYLVSNPPPEPEVYAFGFGRRICPGIHVTQQSIWISISNTLANFDISKAKDEKGLDITPEENYTCGIICHPLPFKCNITPKEGSKEWLLEETA